MSHDEIVALLKAQFPAEAFPALEPDPGRPCVRVAPDALPAVARCVRDDPRLGFNLLRCISGLDLHPEPWFELVYELLALRPGAPGQLGQHGGTLALRVRIARDGGTAPSLAAIWPAAEWHEREAYDMFGVRFEGHPDLRRILCPDDWVGWPLRRDYEFPKEYEGIPSAATTEP